jgi:hypothetical protein
MSQSKEFEMAILDQYEPIDLNEDIRSLMLKDIASQASDEFISWDIIQLSRIRTRLFLGAALAGIIWFLFIALESTFQKIELNLSGFRQTVIITLFGIISLTVSTAIATYLIQYRMSNK